MSVRILSADEIRARLGFADLIEPVSKAFQESSAGKSENGLIVMFPGASPEAGDVYVKTGVLRGHPVHIVKVSPWFKVNFERGQPQGGFIGVFDSETGHTIAILDEQHYLSDVRTAAAGALAARALAPTTVKTAAVLGSGVQAYLQPQALYGERPFERLLIWARNADKASQLQLALMKKIPALEICISTDLERTVRQADVLITATLSKEPLVRGEWLREGQHITAIGADDPTKCELDANALRRARVFVDDFATSAANGDVHRAVQTGSYALEQVAGEIGNVLAGLQVGRSSDAEITVAKFVGIGVQDLVAAAEALKRFEFSQ